MTTYHLPEGMTADVLRDLADDPVANKVYATLHAWADAIDPPKPPSVVTGEMVDDVCDATDMENRYYASWVRKVLEAVERLGWLRDPGRELVETAELEALRELVAAAWDDVGDAFIAQEMTQAQADAIRKAKEAQR